MDRSLSISDDVIRTLRELIKEKPPTLVQGGEIKGVLVDPKQYRILVELLEDIEDLKAAELGEAEYRAGKGRSFAEYDAERKTKRRV